MHGMLKIAESSQDASLVLRGVLEHALRLVGEQIAGNSPNSGEYGRKDAEAIRDTWIRSLREAFWERYRNPAEQSSIAVFGGKPRKGEPTESGPNSGIRGWKRWEFLYDVSVVVLKRIDAPYTKDRTDNSNPRPVTVVDRAIWLVESEVALNGASAAEDISKLRVGRSEHSLFIAATTRQKDEQPWLAFLGRAMEGIGGEAFIALVPTYASTSPDSRNWLDGTVEILLYRCVAGSPPVALPPVSARRDPPEADSTKVLPYGRPNTADIDR
jgi:hypothetical protein